MTVKAAKVLKKLLASGWTVKRVSGTYKRLSHPNYPDFRWCFDDDVELGPRMLDRVCDATGLDPSTLSP